MLLPLKAVQQLSMVEGQSMRHGAVSRHPESGHGKQWCETRAKLTLLVADTVSASRMWLHHMHKHNKP